MLKHPYFLFLFLIYIPLVWWYVSRRRTAEPYIGFSSTGAFRSLGGTWKVVAMHSMFVLRLLAIGAVIFALCRPQSTDSFKQSSVEGTDIVLAFDISGSMSSTDFNPNRFIAAKEVAKRFINARENDNMGLVIFAGESLSLMPLTTDRAALLATLENVQMGDLSDGTAIGDGLSSAINRLATGQAKSKSIILLTDGTNNAGDVAPSTAAEIAAQKGIRIYTIGVGTDGTISITDPFGFPSTSMETKIDEESLKSIASATGGKYFRATSNRMLSDVFEEIDKLEKTRLDVTRYSQTEENFMPFLVLALCLFCVELLMRYLLIRRIP